MISLEENGSYESNKRRRWELTIRTKEEAKLEDSRPLYALTLPNICPRVCIRLLECLSNDQTPFVGCKKYTSFYRCSSLLVNAPNYGPTLT